MPSPLETASQPLPERTGSRLPVQLSSFIGREREIAELRRLLSSTRLLTLTGAGGSGKTRLAVEVASRFAAEQPWSVEWVDLTPLRNPDLVPHAVAAGLGLREEGGREEIERLVEALRDRSVLLVLDSCEHVVDACARLVDTLLRSCAGLRVLATSREALEIAGERAWLVPGLSLPEGDTDPRLQLPGPSEAVQLFAERAQAALAAFALTPDNVETVAKICRRLDGLPLAIELAAARIRVLSPEQIAERLDDTFRLLTTGGRTAIPRHRTLRETIDWSYHLLTEQEQLLFRRLAVFDGGFSLEAAEQVCTGGPIPPEDVLDLLSDLVDKSLVTTGALREENRYGMLETVRQYARERLRESGELDHFRGRHADFFLDMAERAEPHLFMGGRGLDWVVRVETELANLRAAADYFGADPGRVEGALRLAAALDWFYYAQGRFQEARSTLEAALAAGGRASDLTTARALLVLGNTALWQDDVKVARSRLQQSASLLRELGERRLLAYAVTRLGVATSLQGDTGRGRELLEEAVQLAADQDDECRLCVLTYRAYVTQLAGAHALAREQYEAAVVLARALGFTRVTAHLTSGLGRLAYEQQDHELALARFGESLPMHRAQGDRWGAAEVLHGLAGIAAARGDPDGGARLLGAAEAIRQRLRAPLRRDEREHCERVAAGLRGQLGDAAYAAAYAAGHALDFEQAVEYALAWTLASPRGAPADPQPTPGTAAGEPPRASAPPGAALRVQALGPLEIHVDGEPLPPGAWSHARPRELLLFLLSHPEGRTREQIGLVFWPESSAAQVKNSFHVTLHHLRRALGHAEWVVLEGKRYRIDPTLDLDFDAARFEGEVSGVLRRMRDGPLPVASLQEALALYRGDFLEEEAVGDWHLEFRDRLRRLYVQGMSALGDHLMQAGAYPEAERVYERIVALESLDEESHRKLLTCYARQGQRSRALRHYERLVLLLREELDAEPEPETVALAQSLSGALATAGDAVAQTAPPGPPAV